EGALWVLQVLVQTNTRPALPQHARQRRLAYLNRLPPKIRPVQLKQVECVQERLGLISSVAEQLEGGQPPLVTAHHLTVNQARPHLEVVHRLDHQGIAVVQSLNLRVISRMPMGSRRAISRKPSCLIS